MAEKPTLKTGTLLSPNGDGPVTLKRSLAKTGSLSFEGMPPDDSPAQRTFHQSLTNRLISGANVYQFLRGYGLRVHWGYVSNELPGIKLHLAIYGDDGLKVAVLFKTRNTNANWGPETEEQLTAAGWHILILDGSQMVQSPQDAVDSLLRVLRHCGNLEIATGPLEPPAEEVEAPRAGGHHQVAHDHTPATPAYAKVPQRRPLPHRRWRQAVLALLAAGTAAVAGLVWLQPESAETWWKGGISYRTKVEQVKVSKEGHATLDLADGKKAFVPSHALKRNADLLHQLIVAWRQGKPLTIFTTSKQHAKYGRQVGIKDVKAPPRKTPVP